MFRDESEMPASDDLGREIDLALQSSLWLIVVCSPRTPASKWVNREVERFHELGRSHRILALLIEDDLSVSLPPALRRFGVALQSTEDGGGVEPLAADARIRSGESLRVVRRRALLRIVACLAGCRFDEIEDRDRTRRRLGLALLGISPALAIGAAVGGVTLIGRSNDQERALETERRARSELEAVLLQIGRPAVESLAGRLEAVSPAQQIVLLRVLAGMGFAGRAARPVVHRLAVTSTDREVQKAAREALYAFER